MLGTTFITVSSPILPLADGPVVAPLAILFLCVAAGIGTALALPGRQEAAVRRLGGTVLLAAGIILALLVMHAAMGKDLSDTGPYFWIFSAIALFGSIRVITHPRPVYSALYFVLTVFASAGLFVLLYAEFMAAALVLIYAGAILVTYVFVIMLAASAQSPGNAPLAGLAECDAVSREPYTASAIGFALMGVILLVVFDKAENLYPAPTPQATTPVAADEAVHGSTQSIGKYLFEDQLVNLELAGLILTVAMVGAIMIARRRVAVAEGSFEPTAETVTATMTPLSDDPNSIPVYGTTDPKQKAFPQT